MGIIMQEFFYIILLSIGSVVALFILTKLMGYRQLSEMSMFDYIIGITIGSIAAEMATSLEENFMQPLVAMVVYAIFSIALSYISEKSFKGRKIIAGKPVVLINHGEIYEKNLRKSKIDISELLVQCRVNGYFDISKIETAILEENGKISFLPKASERPLTPNDLGMTPKDEWMVANLIIDGKVMEDNLKHSGKDEKWLNTQLASNGVKNVKDVILATCDMHNQFTVYTKNEKEMQSQSALIN